MLPDNFTLLQVTPALDGGGVETLTVDLATLAAHAGARSLVASRGGRLEEALAWGGAQLVRLPVDARNPLTIADNVWRLERLIRREQVSLVHVRSRAPAFSAIAAARRARVPVVTTYHGVYSAGSPLKRWYNGVMTRGDRVIANSSFTRGHILAQHHTRPERIVLIPEGVDVDAFDPRRVSGADVAGLRAAWGVGEGQAAVLVAARLTGWKGHRVLIEALARSPLKDRVRLVFVGDGETGGYGRDLAAMAARAGVALAMPGLSHNLPAAYAAADLIAAPSTKPETFGRSVAEAGAMARLVIASSLGGVAETIVDGETGILAAPGDPDAWAAALGRALDLPPDRRVAMGLAAWTRVRELYSTERMCEATFDLYRELCEARR